MSSGDVTVVGMVSEAHIIEDIGVIVPKHVAVTISQDLASKSKDLYRACSLGHVMRLHTPTANSLTSIATTNIAREEANQLRQDNDRLNQQLEAITARNTLLETEGDRLRAELAELRGQSIKLDAILNAIKDRPVVVQTLSGVTQAAPKAVEETVSGDAPLFIPSQIKSETASDSRMAVEESVSTTSSVSSASSVLKRLRQNGGAK